MITTTEYKNSTATTVVSDVLPSRSLTSRAFFKSGRSRSSQSKQACLIMGDNYFYLDEQGHSLDTSTRSPANKSAIPGIELQPNCDCPVRTRISVAIGSGVNA